MNKVLTIALSLAALATALAASPSAVKVDGLKDKVRLKLGQEQHFKFTSTGDKSLHLQSIRLTSKDKGIIAIRLHVTDSTPFRVEGVATRPYLVVSNGLERTLSFHTLTRLKGSKEFLPVDDDIEPIAPGGQGMKCWESGSLVEEVVLYQFELSATPVK